MQRSGKNIRPGGRQGSCILVPALLQTQNNEAAHKVRACVSLLGNLSAGLDDLSWLHPATGPLHMLFFLAVSPPPQHRFLILLISYLLVKMSIIVGNFSLLHRLNQVSLLYAFIMLCFLSYHLSWFMSRIYLNYYLMIVVLPCWSVVIMRA